MSGTDALQSIDISSELWRTYTYSRCVEFRINDPVKLFVLPNGSHRVIDGNGVTHRPSPDYLGISWMPAPGQPEFVL